MRKTKKILVIFLCIVCLGCGCKLLMDFMWSFGYIPLTDEYDHRIYKKKYTQCKKEFELLIQEVNMIAESISEEVGGEYDSLFILNENPEWIVRVHKGDECVVRWTEPIANIESIEKIENCFEEPFLAVSCSKERDEHEFRIGEYYHIIVSEEGVTVY